MTVGYLRIWRLNVGLVPRPFFARLNIRQRINLLLGCVLCLMMLIAIAGWIGVKRVGGAMSEISHVSMKSLQLLDGLRIARLEAMRAVQEGLAWRPEELEDSTGDAVRIQEGRALFDDIRLRIVEANMHAKSIIDAYEKMPKGAEEAELWSEIQRVWGELRYVDDRQLAVTSDVAAEIDWAQMQTKLEIYRSYAATWGNAELLVTPILNKLSGVVMRRAEQTRDAGDSAISWASALMGSIFVVAMATSGALGLTIARSIQRSLRAIQDTLLHVAETNDFSKRATVAGQDESAQTAQSLNTLLERVQASLNEVSASTREIEDAARKSLEASTRVADASTVQSERTQAMLSVLRAMRVQIADLTVGTGETLSGAYGARGAAETGARNLERVVQEMAQIAERIRDASAAVSSLSDASDRISEIAEAIKELAAQTNRLAINAAIEAARVGESGRGFAVVADEIRRMSESCAASAQNIDFLVLKIRETTCNAVGNMNRLVQQASHSRLVSEDVVGQVHELTGTANRVAASVEGLVAELAEQDILSQRVSTLVEEVAHVSEQNRVVSVQTACVSESLSKSAGSLGEIVGRFRL